MTNSIKIDLEFEKLLIILRQTDSKKITYSDDPKFFLFRVFQFPPGREDFFIKIFFQKNNKLISNVFCAHGDNKLVVNLNKEEKVKISKYLLQEVEPFLIKVSLEREENYLIENKNALSKIWTSLFSDTKHSPNYRTQAK